MLQQIKTVGLTRQRLLIVRSVYLSLWLRDSKIIYKSFIYILYMYYNNIPSGKHTVSAAVAACLCQGARSYV